MKKMKYLAPLLLGLVILGCASTSGLQTAENSYQQAAVVYDALISTVSDGCVAGVIPVATCKQASALQDAVILAQPQVRTLLDMWIATNTKPAGFDAALATITNANTQLTIMQPKKVVTP